MRKKEKKKKRKKEKKKKRKKKEKRKKKKRKKEKRKEKKIELSSFKNSSNSGLVLNGAKRHLIGATDGLNERT